MAYSDWKEIFVDVSDILLDYDNPRVFISNPTQENLLRFLIDEEDSIELANQIYLNRGLPLAEKPVITEENGKYIVLEGNRRISACKILLNPQILNENEQSKIPKIDNEMKSYLKNLPVVLVPNRDSAEAFITIRHSGDKSVKKWSTISVAKRFVNRYRKGESINHIARILDEKPSVVRKGIRFFFFLEFVRNDIEWTEEEKKHLEIYRLETTKLDRFLPFSKKAKEVLKIDFSHDQTIKTELPIETFKMAVKNIIQRIFIKEEIDTRSTMDDVFNDEIIKMCSSDSLMASGKIKNVEMVEVTENIKWNKNQKNIRDNKETESTFGKDEFTSHNKGNAIFNGEQKENKVSERKHNRLATNIESYVNLTGAFPFTNKYQKNKRINVLLNELKNIKYKEYRMAAMYLIRSLLETYTHEYIDHFVDCSDQEQRIKGVAKVRSKRNQKLRDLIYNNIKDHLTKFYAEFDEEIKLIEVMFSENNNTSITKIINFYIHSQTQVPDYLELLDAWKKVSSILKCMDDILYKKTLQK